MTPLYKFSSPIIAPWWKRWCYRLFSKKHVGRSGGVAITAYRWRGVLYIHSEEKDLPKPRSQSPKYIGLALVLLGLLLMIAAVALGGVLS